MIQIEREFLEELKGYVIASLNAAKDHNFLDWIPNIMADLDKIEELLKYEVEE